MAAAAILNFKNFNFWSRDCHRVQYLMQYTKFHQNRTIFHGDMAILLFLSHVSILTRDIDIANLSVC